MTTSSKTNKSRKDKIEKIDLVKVVGEKTIYPYQLGPLLVAIEDKLNEIIDKLNEK